MKWLIATAGIGSAIAGFLVIDYLRPGALITNSGPDQAEISAKRMAERIREAKSRSSHVRGVYMTADVANDRGRAATKLRGDIISLLDETELNAVVIDVKETRGGAIITGETKELIRTLHEKNIWTIARIAVFKDSSQEKIRPDWYLKWKRGGIWRDNRGGSWLDPAAPEVWVYQLAVAKAASDAGFDEIQFDYIRFPSDGNVAAAVYPIFRPGQPKWGILRAFFGYLHENLKQYRPDLILSADLFGYVALQSADFGIGQRLEDVGENFDYVSLMVYPSHYYDGFQVAADPVRNLPALYYPRPTSIANVAANRPYDVVYRTLLIASDVLAGRTATATDQIGKSPQSRPGLDENGKIATSTVSPTSPISSAPKAKLRPWLQDFDLGVDTARGVYYDAAKVRAQIEAAEDAGSSGWLLWNPTNVYTKEALRAK